MFGFKTGASAKDDKKPAPRGTNQPKAADPRMLGTGAAAAAGHKLNGRAAQIEAAIGYADGGKVTGPGTGTSDDIEAVVPEGSYIMPADSTEQIGEQNLAGMGSPVPVNLSNGEYQLPPEQVHAVGVQALNQMKDATHTPSAGEAARGFSPAGRGEEGKPELFFADGGAVQEFSDSVGGYWSSDNAQFDAGSPSTMQRVGRALNPVTSLGSAIGAMHDAAGQGDVAGMGLAVAQAIPVFGSVRAVAPTLKTGARFVPSVGKTAAATAGSAAFGAAADQYTPSEQSFADGGPVYSRIDPDELGRNNTPQRNVIPRPAPIYVDSQGTATRVLPSQSRALVPAGPITGTDVATTRQPSPAGAAPGGASQADFYTNARGETGRGFSPSSSRAVVPAGPVTGTSLAPVNQPTAGAPDAEAPKASARPEPDYRARAEATARAKRDTAAFQAERAAQDARFAQAGQRANLGRPGAGTGLATAAAAIPAAIDTYDVAVDPNSSGLDVATQAAEGVGRTAATLAGTTAGATSGAALGAFGGPAAPLTVPIGAAIGGLVGGAGAYWGAGKAIEKGRELTGTDTQSPIDRVREREAAQSAPQIQQPAPQPAQQVQQPVAQPAPVEQQQAAPAGAATQQQPVAPLENNVTRVGNSFSGTNIGPGFTINGRPSGESFQSEQSEQNKAAVDALMARTPEFGAGSGALATAAGQAPAMGFNPGGPSVTVIGDSSQQDRARQRLISAASTAYRGAQNGQLTANQLRTMSDLIQSDDRNATTLQNTELDNAAALQREGVSQQGANARTVFTEQGQNSRFSQSNQLDQQRLAGDREVQGFQTRAAQRTEKLYQQYENAKPEDRSAIAQQIRDLAGKDTPNRFTVVPGGQGFNSDGTTYTLPSEVLNNQTGDFINRPGARRDAAPARPVGTRSTMADGKVAVWNGSQWIPQ